MYGYLCSSSTSRSPSVGASKRRDKGESRTADRDSPARSTKSSTGTVTPTRGSDATMRGSSSSHRSPSVKARPQTAGESGSTGSVKGSSATTVTSYSLKPSDLTGSVKGSSATTGTSYSLNSSGFTRSVTGSSAAISSTSTRFKTGQEVVTKEGKRATVIGPVKDSQYELAVVTSDGVIEWHWNWDLRN